MISILYFKKGHNSIKNICRVMVLILCTSSNDALFWTEFNENISKGLRIEQT